MNRIEHRRVRFLFGALGCVPVFLAGWFAWLQVLQAGSLPRAGHGPVALSATAADVQRDRSEPLPGPRGTILDRHGAPLAVDCDSFEVRADVTPPRSARTGCAAFKRYCADLALRLADALVHDDGLADRGAARAEHLQRLGVRLTAAFALDKIPADGPLPATVPGHAEILVASDVAVLSAIEALAATDAGQSSLLLHMRHDHLRSYPERELTYGLVGYLEDAPVRDDDGRLVGYRSQAPAGLEAVAALQPGAPGLREYRVDSRSHRFFAGKNQAPSPPTRLETTIDLELQKIAARELEGQARSVAENGGSPPQWGALVLIEIATGDVLAAASWQRDVQHARGAAFTPYQQLYEPGSIVKPLVFALALQRCGLDWNDVYDCSSAGSDHHADVGGRTVRDDHPCGRLTPHEIIVNSSNIGAVKVGGLLSRDEWKHYLEFYGFGRTLDLPLPNERIGRPASKGWLPGITAAQFKRWTGSSYSIGYELQVNALQMARAYLTLLSGQRRELRLVRAVEVDGVRQPAPVAEATRELDPGVVEAVQSAMIDVVSDAEGATGRHVVEAFRKQGIELHGVVAGKTGTAKSRSTVPGKGAVEVRNASFVGFAPANAPRYLAVGVLQRDDSARFYGGSYAAPPAARLLLEALSLEQRQRLRQEPQVSATPGGSGRGREAPETSQAGR
jgi:cell division protein FtsI (penicillin-binding protein 3)